MPSTTIAPVKPEFDFILIDEKQAAARSLSKAEQSRVRRRAILHVHRARKEKAEPVVPPIVLAQKLALAQRTSRCKDLQLRPQCNMCARPPSVVCSWSDRTEMRPLLKLLARPSAQGFELARIAHGVDVRDLASFANADLARIATFFSSTPHQICHIIFQWGHHYLDQLPGRFGQVPVLDDAVNCVLALTRQLKDSPTDYKSPAVLRLYGQALNSLASTLQDPEAYQRSEVLCAAELLSLFEVFDSSGSTRSWSTHAVGAAKLLELRGPQTCLRDDFDKALLKAHGVAIVTEAFHQGKRCFLEQRGWQDLLKVLAFEESSEQGSPSEDELWWKLLSFGGQIPGLFLDVSAVIASSDFTSHQTVRTVALLRGKVHDILRFTLQWHERYKEYYGIDLMTSNDWLTERSGSDTHLKLHGLFHNTLLFTEHFAAALCPWRCREFAGKAYQQHSLAWKMQGVTDHLPPVARFYFEQRMMATDAVAAAYSAIVCYKPDTQGKRLGLAQQDQLVQWLGTYRETMVKNAKGPRIITGASKETFYTFEELLPATCSILEARISDQWLTTDGLVEMDNDYVPLDAKQLMGKKWVTAAQRALVASGGLSSVMYQGVWNEYPRV